jgi:hypothetical protein
VVQALEKLSKIMSKPFTFWHCDESGAWLLENVNESWHEIPAHSKGDLIFRMSLYGLFSGSPASVRNCIKLVKEGKRWPDTLNNEGDAKNRAEYWVSRQRYLHCGAENHKYGPQKNLSRDCFIMLIANTYWHQYEMIREIEIPCKIQRPSLYYWFEYLKSNDIRHKEKYENYAILDIGIGTACKYPMYAKHLAAWMAWIAKSERVKLKLMPHIPHWNLLLRLLCGDNTITRADVENYRPTAGYLWTAEKLPKVPQWLDETEPVLIDKEILRFVHNAKNWK